MRSSWRNRMIIGGVFAYPGEGAVALVHELYEVSLWMMRTKPNRPAHHRIFCLAYWRGTKLGGRA